MSPIEKKTKTFYKYITPTALEGLLTNGLLKLSLTSDVNDPFELSICGKGVDDNAEYDKYGFISLSGSPQIASLWGNYADCYRGACLEFEFPDFSGMKVRSPEVSRMGEVMNTLNVPVFTIKERYASKSTTTSDFFNGTCIIKCQYQTNRVNIADYTNEYIDKLVKDPNHDSYISIRTKLLNWLKIADTLRTKYIQWHTEDEYRIFMELCGKECKHAFINGKLMYFTNDLTQYIRRIIITERCLYNQKQLESAIELIPAKSDIKFHSELEVTTAAFSQNDYNLEGIPLTKDAQKRAEDNEAVAQVIEILGKVSPQERTQLLKGIHKQFNKNV